MAVRRFFESCWLYWLPSDTFPMRSEQRRWALRFLDEFTAALQKTLKLEPKQFLQTGLLSSTVRDVLTNHALDIQTLPGITCPAPGGVMERADLGSCVWFPGDQAEQQRDLFFGHGAMTIWYVAHDESTEAPAMPVSQAVRAHPMFSRVFESFNVDQMFSNLFATRHRALANSKQFTADLKDRAPEVKGTLFVVPLFAVNDFFVNNVAIISKWFDVFEVYVRESPGDSGILLASKTDLTDVISAVVAKIAPEPGEARTNER